MDKQFQLTDVICKIGKICNNIEKHGDEDVTEFNLPVFDLVLDAEQLGQLYGDPYTARGWYNINGDLYEPTDWVRAAAPLTNDVVFENIEANIKLPSDEVLEFSSCRAKDFKFVAKTGGTETVFKLQLCPGLGRENLLLQEYQNREVRLSIADAKVALKKKTRQGDLALVGGGAKDEGEGGDDGEAAAEAERERIREANETERQLGEALRGLEGQENAA